jgi:methyl-accepting chemotaxis protein
MQETTREVPAYLRFRGLFWRSVVGLLAFQALCWGGAAALAYLILSPELAKDYFSAHRTVKATSQLVTPALAVAAGIGFAVVGLGTALSIWRYSRRLLAPLRSIDDLIRALGSGRIPGQGPVAGPRSAGDEAAAALGPLRERVQELQQIARDVQKVALELNYRSAGTSEVTLKDLRAVATQLDARAKELARSAGWFES